MSTRHRALKRRKFGLVDEKHAIVGADCSGVLIDRVIANKRNAPRIAIALRVLSQAAW